MTVRRRLLLGVAGALAAAQARAQPARPPLKLGYLHPRTIGPGHPTLAVLRPQWLKFGYVEGETVLLRSAEGDLTRIPALLDELAGHGVGAVIVVGGAAVRTASRATKSLPIVAIDLETDPVRAGYAANFARPGGNVTGLFLDQPSLAGKWVDLLREAAPQIERLTIVWDAGTGADQLEVARRACRTRGFEAAVLELGALRDFDQAFRPFAGRPRTGIVQLTSPGFNLVAQAFAEAALRHKLPTIAFLKTYVRSGILMAYGPKQDDFYPRAVVIADRILKGTRPGDVPIESPSRFDLAINLNTARSLGLTLPRTLMALADEVIE